MSDVISKNAEDLSAVKDALKTWEQMEMENDVGVSDEHLANVAYPEEAKKESGAVSEQEEPQEEKLQEEPVEQEKKESKAEYYARLTELDRQNRELKQRLKQQRSTEDLSDLVKKDPKAVLQQLGLGLEDVLDLMVDSEVETDSSEKTTNENPYIHEIKSLKEKLSTIERQQQESQRTQQMQVEYKRISDIISADTENKWELVKSQGSAGLHRVLQTAVEVYNETKEAPDYDLVLDAVEEHLYKQNMEAVEQLKSLSKFKSVFEGGEEKKVVVSPQPFSSTPSRTLGDNRPASTPAPREESARERYLSALAVLDKVQKDQ